MISLKELVSGKTEKQISNSDIQKSMVVDGYLTNQEVTEFQRLALQVFGKALTFEESREQGFKLAMAFDLMLDNLDTIDNDRN
jgi:hypothetical protein